MNLGTINNALDHRISEGSEYQWKCYGPRARYMDYTSNHADITVIYDTATQDIYEATTCPKDENGNVGVYRWINPEHKARYLSEANRRGVDHTKAWDDVEWCDLDVAEDWLEKATAIFNNQPYNDDVLVSVEMEDHEWLKIAFAAHEKNMTLNAFINQALRHSLAIEELRLASKKFEDVNMMSLA
jgi:hypothetical protein